MAHGQLLSLILARQHQTVADPWSKSTFIPGLSKVWPAIKVFPARVQPSPIFGPKITRSLPTFATPNAPSMDSGHPFRLGFKVYNCLDS